MERPLIKELFFFAASFRKDVKKCEVACPKFGHPALSLQFLNYAVHRVCSWCKPSTKNIKSSFKINNSQFLLNYFSRTKITILTWQVNVQTLDRVSELMAQFPTRYVYKYQLFFFIYYQFNFSKILFRYEAILFFTAPLWSRLF